MTKDITIIGAGVAGLWCGYLLSRAGHQVRIFEGDDETLSKSCSYRAGGMLAPYCEAEAGGTQVTIYGTKSLALWIQHFPDYVTQNGSLLLAHQKDINQLEYFKKITTNHELWDHQQIHQHESDLASFFRTGIFYPHEGHLEPRLVLKALIAKCRENGVQFEFNTPAPLNLQGLVINTAGMKAQNDLPNLRGVRGEMIVIKSSDVKLHRPIRLLHHKYPLYIVPRANDVYMIGATTIESDNGANISLRSAGGLLTQAYNLHPAFAEAEILEMNAGIRPAFENNFPQIITDKAKNKIYLNGLYRHGWLLAPIMAQEVVLMAIANPL